MQPPSRRISARIGRWLRRMIRQAELEATRAHNDSLLHQMRECGHGVGIWGRIHVTGAEHIVVGNNVHIGDNAFIRAEGGLTIGDNTHISRNLVLYTINHRIDGARLPYDDEYVMKPVRIGRNVWIGMNVCIVPGTTIGDGVVVGMGTVVSGEVPALSIVVGSKCRVVGYRDAQHYSAIDLSEAYGGPSGCAYRSPDDSK